MADMRKPLSAALWMGLALASWGAAPADRVGESPVLVELFTSQGCSSCPPAEDWLNGEGMTLFQQGKIIPLAFHVDYWDYLGWKDPFSSGANTQRQKRYAALWKSRSIYTPQMVVQGKSGFVGSNGARATEEIGKAKTGAFPLGMKVHPVPQGFQLELEGKAPAGTEVWAVLFENGCVTKVERGENAGSTLIENFVVREWFRMDTTSPGRLRTTFKVPFGKDPGKMGLAVFLQDPSSLNVLSARCLFPFSKKQR